MCELTCVTSLTCSNYLHRQTRNTSAQETDTQLKTTQNIFILTYCLGCTYIKNKERKLFFYILITCLIMMIFPKKFHFSHTYEVYIRVVVIGLLDVNDIRQMCGLIDVTLDISVSLT